MRAKTDEKRNAIIAAATAVFEEVGYRAASMAMISARLGGSKTTLYGYFHSKEQLFATVVTQGGDGYGAAQAFVHTVSKVVGGEAIDDAMTFFRAFEGMEQGFRDRAGRVLELLSHDETAFVLVASPRRDTVEEAGFFAERLGEADIAVRALIVNRMHPRFGTGTAAAARERADAFRGSDLGGLYTNLADFALVASREEEHLRGLATKVAPAPVIRVPFLASDVHDLDGLATIGTHLFDPIAAHRSSAARR